jgi:hypothetical protein
MIFFEIFEHLTITAITHNITTFDFSLLEFPKLAIIQKFEPLQFFFDDFKTIVLFNRNQIRMRTRTKIEHRNQIRMRTRTKIGHVSNSSEKNEKAFQILKKEISMF